MSQPPRAMPTNNTLHQLSSSPSQWGEQLTRISQVWQTQDTLLLLADAAQGYHDARLSEFATVVMLTTDAQLLGISTDQPTVRLISHAQWADAVLTHQRCLTWR